MRREALVAGLDIGSTKACAVIAEAVGDGAAAGAKVLGVGLARTTGVRRGLVRNIEETTAAIKRALKDAERMAGVEVPAVYCGVSAENVRTQLTNGVVAVAAEEIRPRDVQRVHEVARSVSLGEEYELLLPLPQEYSVDKQGGIRDPVGMTGMRLEVEMQLLAVQTRAAQNLRKSVEQAGCRVLELVVEPLAAAEAVLTEEERELGCALVELGGGSTTVAVFHDGKLRHIASSRFAGAYVTKDIVHGLNVTQADAERLKERWGVAYEPLVDPDEEIEIPGTPGQGARRAERRMLAHIVQQRLSEIFDLVADEIGKAGFGELPAGVVLSGGGAQMAGIVELGREVFAMPVRQGMPERGIRGLVDTVQAPRYAVPVGLALYGARQRAQADAAGDTAVERVLGPVKRWLQEFF